MYRRRGISIAAGQSPSHFRAFARQAVSCFASIALACALVPAIAGAEGTCDEHVYDDGEIVICDADGTVMEDNYIEDMSDESYAVAVTYTCTNDDCDESVEGHTRTRSYTLQNGVLTPTDALTDAEDFLDAAMGDYEALYGESFEAYDDSDDDVSDEQSALCSSIANASGVIEASDGDEETLDASLASLSEALLASSRTIAYEQLEELESSSSSKVAKYAGYVLEDLQELEDAVAIDERDDLDIDEETYETMGYYGYRSYCSESVDYQIFSAMSGIEQWSGYLASAAETADVDVSLATSAAEIARSVLLDDAGPFMFLYICDDVTCTSAASFTFHHYSSLHGTCITYYTEKFLGSATGHDYDVDIYWAGTENFYDAAEYMAWCSNSNCDAPYLTGEATVTSVTTEPTCTTIGKTVYTASVELDGVTYTETETENISKLGHSYEYNAGTWDWTGSDEEGWTAATYTRVGVCANDSSHVVSDTYEASVTSETTAATRTTDGSVVYEATVTVDDTTLTDTKTVTIDAHSALVAIEAVEATCTEAGTAACWQCETCGRYFSDADATSEIDAPEETDAATGHSWRYATGAFEWSEDHAEAEYVVACSNGCGETETYDASVSTATTNATCASAGSIVYTATATIGEVTYTYAYTEVISVLDHTIDFTSATWTWASGHTGATLTGTCSVCNQTVTFAADSVSSVVTSEATTAQAGTRTWTASLTYGGETYETTDVEAIAKVSKLANTLAVKAKGASLKAASLKRRAVKLARGKVLTVTGAKGTLTFKKVSGDKVLSVNRKTGAVTVKRGAKRGTHKMKLAVSAAGTSSYASATRTVTVKVRVR